MLSTFVPTLQLERVNGYVHQLTNIETFQQIHTVVWQININQYYELRLKAFEVQ